MLRSSMTDTRTELLEWLKNEKVMAIFNDGYQHQALEERFDRFIAYVESAAALEAENEKLMADNERLNVQLEEARDEVRDTIRDARDMAAELEWKNRQGEDYGSY